jgi:uncharacterized protein (DUF1015 family)
MKKFLNVTDERLLKKEGVYFVQTLEQIEKLAADKKAVGFILKGVDIDIVREISESGMVMPQKSTYFYPKLQTGLVFYQF